MTDDPRPEARQDAPAEKMPSEKMQKLADEAIEAGRKLLDSDTGRKVADVAGQAFDKAEALASQALATDTGRKVAETAGQVLEQVGTLAKQALDSDTGRQVGGALAEPAKVAQDAAKTQLGRNVGIGAAVGVAASIVLPFGALAGVLIGGGLGYLRTLTKKP